MPEPSVIAVFLPNWVGDAVMATPALRAIRAHFPKARLVGVLDPYVAGVFEGTSRLDEVVFHSRKGPMNARWLSVISRLRRMRIDLAVLFTNSFRSAFVAWLGRCRRRVGYARDGRSWLLTDRLIPLRDKSGNFQPSPVIDAYNLLAEHIGCPSPGHRMELATLPDDERAADAVWSAAGWIADEEVVCLNVGAAFGSSKHWPERYFARLACSLVDQRGSKVLILCGPGERESAQRIVAMAGRDSVHALASQPLSLGLTKACIRRATLLVTTDSGPRHFAAAFDRPVVTLFGPTHIAWTETYHPKAVHLQRKVDCGPCQRRVCPLDHRCMEQLTPDAVFVAVEELLGRSGTIVRQRSLAG